MGVPGLWDVLQEDSERVSLTRIALEGFQHNKEERALRLGVDASLWIFQHKAPTTAGLNAIIRTLFFKILKLLQHPILPLFVFDGPEKPKMKRNQKTTGHFGTNDKASRDFKRLLDEMGLEYWNAPGEAEAELAHMSKSGAIDAVLTDDSDALLFGARKILRNCSKSLSANKHLDHSSEFNENYQVFIQSSETGIGGLSEDRLIFFALCAGGDYHPAGLPSCGTKIAHALAQTPLAAELIQSYRTFSPSSFQAYLPAFIEALKQELATNSLGFLPSKRKQLAANIPPTFPQLDVLESYIHPRVSRAGEGYTGFGSRMVGTPGAGINQGKGDPRRWAAVCEKYFEWGTREIVARRMKTSAWKGQIIQHVREEMGIAGPSRMTDAVPPRPAAAPSGSQNTLMTSYFTQARSSQSVKGKGKSVSPSLEYPFYPAFAPPSLVKIHSSRQHPSTGKLPEYRVEYDPKEWSRAVQGVMKGARVDPALLPAAEREAMGLRPLAGDSDEEDRESSSSGAAVATNAKKQVDPDANDRVWLPAEYVRLGWPELVDDYDRAVREKVDKAALRTPRKGKKTAGAASSTKKKQERKKAAHVPGWTSEEEEEVEAQRSLMQTWLSSGSTRGSSPPRRHRPQDVLGLDKAKGRESIIDLTSTPRSPSLLPLLGSPSVQALSSPLPSCLPMPSKKVGARPAPSSASTVPSDISEEEWASPRRLFVDETAKKTPRGKAAVRKNGRSPPKSSKTSVDDCSRRTKQKAASVAATEVIEVGSSSEEEEEVYEGPPVQDRLFTPPPPSRTRSKTPSRSPFVDDDIENDIITPRPYRLSPPDMVGSPTVDPSLQQLLKEKSSMVIAAPATPVRKRAYVLVRIENDVEYYDLRDVSR